MSPLPHKILIIGVGNLMRGDDAAGLTVADEVAACVPEIPVMASDGDAAMLLDAWNGLDLAIVVDAVQPGGFPGRIVRFELPGDAMPAVFSRHVSSHGMGLNESIELAQIVGSMPRRLIVFGIEGAQFQTGALMHPAVQHAVKTVAATIVVEVTAAGSSSGDNLETSARSANDSGVGHA